MVNARLHVFLQPAIATTDKALTPHEKGLRFTKAGYFSDPEYYEDCYQRIAARSWRPRRARERRVHEPGGACSIGCPTTQDIFLDSLHFGDRGSLMIAQAIVEADAV